MAHYQVPHGTHVHDSLSVSRLISLLDQTFLKSFSTTSGTEEEDPTGDENDDHAGNINEEKAYQTFIEVDWDEHLEKYEVELFAVFSGTAISCNALKKAFALAQLERLTFEVRKEKDDDYHGEGDSYELSIVFTAIASRLEGKEVI